MVSVCVAPPKGPVKPFDAALPIVRLVVFVAGHLMQIDLIFAKVMSAPNASANAPARSRFSDVALSSVRLSENNRST